MKQKTITEIKKSEEETEGCEERYHKLFNGITDAVFVHLVATEGKPPGRFIEVNDVACQKLGYTREELLKLSYFDITAPEELKNISAIRKKFLPWKHYLFEIVAVTKNGKKIPLEINIHQFDLGGQPAVLSIARDITERKRMEEALKESERRFRELADLLPQTVFETDIKGNLTFANSIVFDTFGYARKDFNKGLNVSQILVAEDRNRGKRNFQRILKGKNGDQGNEYTALEKDGGTFPAIVYSSPIIHKNKTVGLRGVLIDIAERKQIEKAKDEFISMQGKNLVYLKRK